MKSSPIQHETRVNGRGNIIIQNVDGSDININYNDPKLEGILKSLDFTESRIEELKKEAAQHAKRYRITIGILSVLMIGISSISIAQYILESQKPFDHVITVLDSEGKPSKALTGALDKLTHTGEDPYLIDSVEISRFWITHSDPPLEGRIEETYIRFDNLPATYKNTSLPFRLESPFYQVKGNLQELVLEGESSTLIIERNDALCCIKGFVGAADKELQAIKGAKIFLAGEQILTDENGYFEILIPKAQQARQLKIRISYPGYRDRRETIYPGTKTSQAGSIQFPLYPLSK